MLFGRIQARSPRVLDGQYGRRSARHGGRKVKENERKSSRGMHGGGGRIQPAEGVERQAGLLRSRILYFVLRADSAHVYFRVFPTLVLSVYTTSMGLLKLRR